MGFEFGNFYSTYQALHPKFKNGFFLSPACLAIIESISNDMSGLCQDVLEEIDIFQRQDKIASRDYKERHFGWFSLRGREGIAKARNKRILRFFRENNMALRRNQLRYADLLLKLILAVVVHAQDQLPSEGAANVNGFHNYLVQSVSEGLVSMRRIETDLKTDLGVASLRLEASRWWAGFPPRAPGVAPINQLEELARVWVNAEARIPHSHNADVNELQTMMHRLRDNHERELRRIRGDQETRIEEHAAELRRINEARQADLARYDADRARWDAERDRHQEEMMEFRQGLKSLQTEVQKLSKDLDDQRRGRENEKKRNRQQEARLRDERNGLLHERDSALAEKLKAERQARQAEQDRQEKAVAQEKLERRSKLLQRENDCLQEKLLHLTPQHRHPSERSSSSTRTRRSSSRTSSQIVPLSSRTKHPPISYDNRANRPTSPSSGSTTAAEDEGEIPIGLYVRKGDISEAPLRRSYHSGRTRHMPGM